MEKREQIIAVTEDLFAEKGILLSMAEIAEGVGIKTQSLYSHYKSKGNYSGTLIFAGENLTKTT